MCDYVCGIKGLGLLFVDVLLCAVLFVEVVTTVTQTVICIGLVCRFYCVMAGCK